MSDPLRLALPAEPEPAPLPFEARRTQREILELLLERDPLDLYATVCRRVDERAYLLDEETVTRRATAACALAARSYGGTPDLRRWVLVHIDRVIESLLEEDVEAERGGPPNPAPGMREFRFTFIAEALGQPVERGRRLCNWINALPERTRKAFYEVEIKGLPAELHACRSGLTQDEVEGALALAAALLARDSEHDAAYALPLCAHPFDELVAEDIGCLDTPPLETPPLDTPPMHPPPDPFARPDR